MLSTRLTSHPNSDVPIWYKYNQFFTPQKWMLWLNHSAQSGLNFPHPHTAHFNVCSVFKWLTDSQDTEAAQLMTDTVPQRGRNLTIIITSISDLSAVQVANDSVLMLLVSSDEKRNQPSAVSAFWCSCSISEKSRSSLLRMMRSRYLQYNFWHDNT